MSFSSTTGPPPYLRLEAAPSSGSFQDSECKLPHVSTTMQCPYCHQQVRTVIRKKNGMGTYLTSAGIFITGVGLFGCFLIPFIVDSFKDTMHCCPNCDHLIGMRKIIK